jgi:hypothetical protein
MAAPNVKQKLFVIDIAANTQATLQSYLDLGYVLHQIVSLTPTYNKLLLVYYDPQVEA